MATTSQREAIKTVDQSWTAEVKSKCEEDKRYSTRDNRKRLRARL